MKHISGKHWSYVHPKLQAFIDSSFIKIIVEAGSRDCLDAIKLRQYYKGSTVYAFECNPESIEVCKKNIKGTDIILIKKAVSNKNGKAKFYATDMDLSTDKNIGASSLLFHRNQKTYIQKQIEVDTIRLDTWMNEIGIEEIDLLCMDLQSAEPLALEGLGEKIHTIRYIISEVATVSYYHGDILKLEFLKLMEGYGFIPLIAVGAENILFKNTLI